jgi:alpha-tubulin suppressor-like RCC1 family protein
LGLNSSKNEDYPKQIEFIEHYQNIKCVDISAGFHFSLVLFENNNLYSFGNNQFGRLGIKSSEKSISYPKLVQNENFKNRKITSIKAGFYHSLIICNDSKIFSFGYNFHGQLGDGTIENKNYPIEVNFNNFGKNFNFSSAAIGAEHSIALTAESEIFCWGNNFFGQIGDDTTTSKILPILISNYGKKIKNVFAGYYCSFFITDESELYSFGHIKDEEVLFIF